MPNKCPKFLPIFFWMRYVGCADWICWCFCLQLKVEPKQLRERGDTECKKTTCQLRQKQGNIRKHGNVTSQALLPDRLWWIINESISQKYPLTIDTNRCASVPCLLVHHPHLGRWWFAAWFQGVGWDPLVSMGWFIGEFAATKIRYAWYLYVCQIEFMMHDVMYELFKKYKELQDLFGIMLGVQDLTGIVRPWHLCMAKALHLSTGSERWDP